MKITYDMANDIGITVNTYTDWYERQMSRAIGIIYAKLGKNEAQVVTSKLGLTLEDLMNIMNEIAEKDEIELVDEAIKYYDSTSFVFRKFFETIGENFKNENLEELIKQVKE